MNRKLTLSSLVLAAAFAGSAFAESPNAGVANDNFVSSRTRADAAAELTAYKQSGVNPWSTQYNPLRNFKSTATRADVTAGYLASRDEVHALTAEDSGSAYLAQARVTSVPPTTLAGQPRNAQ
jgi:hypothetical protein